MAITATFNPSTRSIVFPKFGHSRSSFASPYSLRCITTYKASISAFPLTWRAKQRQNPMIVLFSGGDGSSGGNGGRYNGGAGGGGGDDEGEQAGDKNKAEAILALAEVGRSLDGIPSDLASAIVAGRIPGSIVYRYIELEKSPLFRWLLQFGGFKERLLADDLFFAKVSMEVGVGILAKVGCRRTSHKRERQRRKGMKEREKRRRKGEGEREKRCRLRFSSSCANHFRILQASPGTDFFKSSRRTGLEDFKMVTTFNRCKSSRRTGSEDFKTVTTFNRCKLAFISFETDNGAKNTKNSNSMVPLTDSDLLAHETHFSLFMLLC